MLRHNLTIKSILDQVQACTSLYEADWERISRTARKIAVLYCYSTTSQKELSRFSSLFLGLPFSALLHSNLLQVGLILFQDSEPNTSTPCPCNTQNHLLSSNKKVRIIFNTDIRVDSVQFNEWTFLIGCKKSSIFHSQHLKH